MAALSYIKRWDRYWSESFITTVQEMDWEAILYPNSHLPQRFRHSFRNSKHKKPIEFIVVKEEREFF